MHVTSFSPYRADNVHTATSKHTCRNVYDTVRMCLYARWWINLIEHYIWMLPCSFDDNRFIYVCACSSYINCFLYINQLITRMLDTGCWTQCWIHKHIPIRLMCLNSYTCQNFDTITTVCIVFYIKISYTKSDRESERAGAGAGANEQAEMNKCKLTRTRTTDKNLFCWPGPRYHNGIYTHTHRVCGT